MQTRASLIVNVLAIVAVTAMSTLTFAEDGTVEQCLCEQTGGTWDPLSCGHYQCGEFPPCDAIIPGCDCGPGRTFVTGLGCLADVTCDPLGPVLVVVDMDAAEPGIQRAVRVTTCATVVEDVAIYVIDPQGSREMWSIGYIGALDRGISFGHVPTKNAGSVTAITGVADTPVNPGNTGAVIPAPFFDGGLLGPEVQYLEFGANSAAVISSAPTGPIFTVDIELAGVTPGDRFSFYLLDMVSAWTGGNGGAFSTQGPLITLDTGGDAVPDATISIHGVDADPGLPVPPAAFYVDYIDGPPATGPAVIEIIAAPVDLDGNGTVGFGDVTMLLAVWGPCPPFSCAADLDGSGVVGFADLTVMLAKWGGCGA